jgi:hypothetical protein
MNALTKVDLRWLRHLALSIISTILLDLYRDFMALAWVWDFGPAGWNLLL